MPANPNQVIVTQEEELFTAIPVCILHAHHRDFPEIRAEGETLETAAGHLTDQLCRALECVPDTWHRRDIEQAIEDVRAFVSKPH